MSRALKIKHRIWTEFWVNTQRLIRLIFAICVILFLASVAEFVFWLIFHAHQLKVLVLQVRAQGLAHEAVIEIMIALLGIMLTVLAILIALFAFFGYSAIKDEAVRKAVAVATAEARKSARAAARRAADESEIRFAAGAYTESQKELGKRPKDSVTNAGSNLPRQSGRRKAAKDANLNREGEK